MVVPSESNAEKDQISVTLVACYLLSLILRAFEAEAKKSVKKLFKWIKKQAVKLVWRRCQNYVQQRSEGLTSYAPEREVLGIIAMTSSPPSFAEAVSAAEMKRCPKAHALLRLILWHLIQPLSYFAIFAVYAHSLSRIQYFVAIIVLIREIVYLIATVLLASINPSFLVTTPFSDVYFARTRRGVAERLGMAGWYIISPEKFVWQCLVVNITCRWTGVSSIFILEGRQTYLQANFFLELGIWALFLCDLVALFGLFVSFAENTPLPLRIALSFALAAASGIMVITTIIHAHCCMSSTHDSARNHNKQQAASYSGLTSEHTPPSYSYAISH